ncbi:hypothetical protein QVZ41_12965 [Wenyingzhuangia sp. chi5]|uniref:BIG2 domain-containing protein n=1 Tax=Wenyingzhuangia gilva TaxID=3057677 RepID=A0ABT8VUW0_9FLAO|nr:hypothetical protein [Wenyingzhuangia sp. chi5]MDO3695754.1 hypothetical protein [Wenyingzhuangia sp. chi5]
MKKTLLLFIAVIGLSCTKEEFDSISLSISQKSLNTEEVYQIEADSNSKIIYSTENEYHSKVTPSGMVTAKFVGETNILLENAEDSKTIKIIVEPKYNTYPEPEFEFGDTKNDIIHNFGENYEEISLEDEGNFTLLGYNNYFNKAPIILFVLDSDQKIASYAVLIHNEYVTELAGFLTERYLAYAEQEETFYFINQLDYENASLLLGLGVYNEDYVIVQYFDTSTPDSMENYKTSSTITKPKMKDLMKKWIIK